MYGMEMARERIQDRIREADAYRLSRRARSARAAENRGRARRVAHAALTGLLWPIRH
jgi:hypothetical protein